MIFNEFAQVVVSVQKEFEQYFPHPGSSAKFLSLSNEVSARYGLTLFQFSGWMEEKPEDLCK